MLRVCVHAYECVCVFVWAYTHAKEVRQKFFLSFSLFLSLPSLLSRAQTHPHTRTHAHICIYMRIDLCIRTNMTNMCKQIFKAETRIEEEHSRYFFGVILICKIGRAHV